MLVPEPGSPDWWLLRLGRKLYNRRPELDRRWDWYTGNHPLPQAPAKAVQAYRDFQKNARTNFLAMVVDASVNRLNAIGITGADGKPDDQAWSWWQLNKMDSRQKTLYRTALALGVAYVIVGEHPDKPGQPLISIEHPRDCITEHDPATGEVKSALKVWYDEIERLACADVWVKGEGRTEYRREQAGRRFALSAKTWEPGVQVNDGFDRPPVLAFECRPELGEEPQPEFARGIEPQNRINLGVLNRMTVGRISAHPQRWVTGHQFATRTEMVTEVDSETGLPISVPRQIPDGNPFIPDPASTWASSNPDAKFGQFPQADMLGYLKVHDADIRDLLVLTATPTYVVAGDLVNIATETVVALDELNQAKVGEHQTNWGEQEEEMFGLCSVVAGEPRDFTEHEVRWQNSRHLNPAVLADMATKLKAVGYPLEALAEKIGESPQKTKRIVAMAAGEAMLRAGAEQAARQPTPPPRSTREGRGEQLALEVDA
ncbi:phage portal protein [Streptodolium elevatio]|uniref:Phage portal protein n=1 Tax=Streptodolium elevatio TaxID=3157996 RepID=A0ABV3DLG0_9ACTN